MGLLRPKSANTADTVWATADTKTVDLPAGWRIGVAGAREHQDQIKVAAEIASSNAPTGVAISDDDKVACGWFTAVLVPEDDKDGPHAVAVSCTEATQGNWIPASLCSDACRRGPGTE